MVDLKNEFVKLYIKRFVIPKALIFDKPGFVDFKISGKTNVFARQILMPESFFVNLEESIIKSYGKDGKVAIYSVGKKFGYSFAQLGKFENITELGNKVKDWIIITSKFVEGTYASEITPTIDLENKTVDYSLKNFVIARKIGYDLFFSTGGTAGLVAWLLQDKTIECYSYDIKLNNQNIYEYKVKSGPKKTLEKFITSEELFIETNLDNLNQNISEYIAFNSEVVITSKSFSNFLDAGIFSYENGIITLKSSNERFFLMESSGMYLLESELKKRKLDQSIFNIAYFAGKDMFGGIITDSKSAADLLTALGWGEVIILNSNKNIQIIINHFPWTNWYKDIDFLIIRGFLSGILSKINNKNLEFNKPILDINKGYLSLLFKEKSN